MSMAMPASFVNWGFYYNCRSCRVRASHHIVMADLRVIGRLCSECEAFRPDNENLDEDRAARKALTKPPAPQGAGVQ